MELNNSRDNQGIIDTLTKEMTKPGWAPPLLQAPLALISPTRKIEMEPIFYFLQLTGYYWLCDILVERIKNRDTENLWLIRDVIERDGTPFLRGVATLLTWIITRIELGEKV